MENAFRLRVFAQSLKDAKRYNSSHVGTTYELTRASDMSDSEFMALFPKKEPFRTKEDSQGGLKSASPSQAQEDEGERERERE